MSWADVCLGMLALCALTGALIDGCTGAADVVRAIADALAAEEAQR